MAMKQDINRIKRYNQKLCNENLTPETRGAEKAKKALISRNKSH